MHSYPVSYLWLIPILPLAGAIINGFFGNRLRRSGVVAVGTGAVALAFVLSIVAIVDLSGLAAGRRSIHQELYKWLVVGDLQVTFTLVVDTLTSMMLLIITGVGSLIHLYSAGYMAHDKSPARFFAYLNLFIFAMLILVMGSNLITMFIGWEGVGLCSYLLIGFWYEDYANADAGKKAFITNRIGDAGFLLGTFLIFSVARTVEFRELFELIAIRQIPVPVDLATIAALLLFVGAVGKSAQIPLYVWLPDAMAGPTPVSALIHAATMVTAGIYMIARLYPLFLSAPDAMMVIAWVGAATAFFAATIALVQNDIKKVLAYSTVSQLGFMFLGMGVGAFRAGMFHLMTHAFFKALLFLGSGVVIHAMEHAHGADDPQDMRTMGGLREKMPRTYWAFIVGTIAIAGFPPFSGFFSKDEIIWNAFASGYGFGSTALWIVASLAALCTAFYMFRLLFMTFHGSYRGAAGTFDKLHDPDLRMGIPLLVLSIAAAGAGLLGIPEIFGHTIHMPHLLGKWLSSWFYKAQGLVPVRTDSHTVEAVLMVVAVAIAFTGAYVAWRMYGRREYDPDRPVPVPALHKLLSGKYYVDEIWATLVLNPMRWLSSNVLFRVVDRVAIDGAVHAVGGLVKMAGESLRAVQTGQTGTYLGWILLAVIGILLAVM